MAAISQTLVSRSNSLLICLTCIIIHTMEEQKNVVIQYVIQPILVTKPTQNYKYPQLNKKLSY